MNLNKVKKDINHLKKDIGATNKATMQGFYKYCEKTYNRPVDIGELLFSEYVINHKKVKSNRLLFLRLSEQYFTELHQVDNPVRNNSKFGLKGLAVLPYADMKYQRYNAEIESEIMNHDDDFNNWFDKAWNQIINDGDFTLYNEKIKEWKNR